MNWKLILQLSLFALAMGVATVFVIPSKIEPMLWLPIFLICAYLIARFSGGRVFGHGVVLGLVNSVWITAAHIVFFGEYIASHPAEAKMMESMPAPDSPRLMMAMVGPVVGLISGLVIGLFAFVASKFVRPRVGAASR